MSAEKNGNSLVPTSSYDSPPRPEDEESLRLAKNWTPEEEQRAKRK